MIQTKVALFDIDKTIYDGFLIFPLAEYFFQTNIISKHTLDSLFQDLHLYRSGQVDYETSIECLNMHWAFGLKKYSPDLILRATEAFLKTKAGRNFFPFVKPLIALLKKTHDIYFVTGEVQCVGKAVADHFSINGYIATEMEVEHGVFTGKIVNSLARKEAKRSAIEPLFNVYSYENSVGFGDSEGDIELLDMVAHAFCINATEGLKQVAIARKWHIVSPLSILEAVKAELKHYGLSSA